MQLSKNKNTTTKSPLNSIAPHEPNEQRKGFETFFSFLFIQSLSSYQKNSRDYAFVDYENFLKRSILAMFLGLR